MVELSNEWKQLGESWRRLWWAGQQIARHAWWLIRHREEVLTRRRRVALRAGVFRYAGGESPRKGDCVLMAEWDARRRGGRIAAICEVDRLFPSIVELRFGRGEWSCCGCAWSDLQHLELIRRAGDPIRPGEPTFVSNDGRVHRALPPRESSWDTGAIRSMRREQAALLAAEGGV